MVRKLKAADATAFAGGWVVGGKGSSPAQAQSTVLSHFKCYSIVGGKNPPQIVDLQDQFILRFGKAGLGQILGWIERLAWHPT